MKRLFISLLLLSTTIGYQVSAQYSGRVFIDTNQNGKYDQGEKVLSNIAVSDGLHVVHTNLNGVFKLPGHEKGKFIFITTPSGYKPIQQHYHAIEGNSNFDFPLAPQNNKVSKKGAHSFIHITDTEIFNTEGHEDWVGNLRDYTANERTSFIVHTGDICYENGLKNHIKLMNTQNMSCPVYYCVGNHDLVAGDYGEQLFESLYGPVYYSFEVGNTHYVVTPMPGGDHRPSYKMDDVLKWLKNDLAAMNKNKSVVFFNHDLQPYEKWGLENYTIKGWAYGHWHINYMKKLGDVMTISTGTLDKGGIDHSTSAFRVVNIDDKGDLSSDLRYTYINNQIEIASEDKGELPLLKNNSYPIVVNTYSSVSPTEKVNYFIRVGSKQIYTGLLQQKTDWSWYTELPANRLKGNKQFALVVTTTFKNGQQVSCEKQIELHNTSIPISYTRDWTNLLGNPQHIGTVKESASLPYQLAWITNIGANLFMSSPLIYKGNVFVASVDENLKGEAAIIALDGTTGETLWKYPVRNSIKNSIAIENGIVFGQDADGYLYAIDSATGKLVWEYKLNIASLPALIEGVVAADGKVYAGTGKGLAAFDSKTGKCLWTNEGWSQHEGTTSTFSLGNNVLVGGSQWGGLHANDASNGKHLWSRSEDGLSDRGASAAIHGNLIYIISRSSLFIMDLHSGKTIVRKELPVQVDATSTPLLSGDYIIFGTSTDGIMALHRETLEEAWRVQTEPALIYTAPYTRKPVRTVETSPVAIGNLIITGASDGNLYAIDREKGEIVWQHVMGVPVFSTIAVSGNTFIVTDFGGNVYAFTYGE